MSKVINHQAYEVTDETKEMIDADGIAYVVFACKGWEEYREEFEPGWYNVRSGFVIYNDIVGYFSATYNESNGYESGEFHRISKAERKRGPLPKGVIVINGERYYLPWHV